MSAFSLPTDRPLRILVGTKEIAGQLVDYAEGFRALGHHVTTAVRERHAFYPEATYDVDLSSDEGAGRIPELIAQHDLFVFQFGSSLLPGQRDLPWLARMKKPVIAIFNGDDIRHSSAYHQEYGVEPQWQGDFYVTDPVSRPLRTLRIFERYASLIVSVPNQSGLALRPYMHFAYPMDPALYRAHRPDRDVPVVVHAPSDRLVKGTARILATLDELAASGHRFELRLLEKVPNSTVRDVLADADIAIDQLYGGYGKFAAEALASSCATATARREEIEPFARLRPIQPIAQETLRDDLTRLLTDRAWRRTLETEGPDHVARYHDRTVVCRRLLDALVAAGDGTLRYDYYPAYLAERYVLPADCHLPRSLRVLSSEIVQAHGIPEGTDLSALVQRGFLDVAALGQGAPPVTWSPTDGLLGAVASPAALESRWAQFREPARRPAKRTRPAPRDTALEKFWTSTDVLDPKAVQGTALEAVADEARLALRHGLHFDALQQLLPHATAHPSFCRAVALLLLGTGQAADAEAMLDLCLAREADPILRYYRVIARLLQQKHEGLATEWLEVVRTLPRTPTVDFFGTTPILNTHHWAAGLRAAGRDARTLMREYYGRICRREDFDYYLPELVPTWTDPRLVTALAPYHALLFVLLHARMLHTNFDGGPLHGTPAEPFEPELLRAAGVSTVVITYGADGAMYSRIVDASIRHAIQLSYPAAARKESEIAARVDRWSRAADCIIGCTHSLDGHPRWDILLANPGQLDLQRWHPKDVYSPHDGRTGPVRIVHSPNHRGVKGTEFIVAAVDRLRAEGLQVELDLVEGIQNSAIPDRLRAADILAEQLVMVSYGLNGVEGLAVGLPVVANMAMDHYLEVFRRFSHLDECPVVCGTPETIGDVLRTLVTQPALRETLGRASRAYAEKYHGYRMTQHLFDAVRRKAAGEDVDLMNLYHPLRSAYVQSAPITHPLVKHALPTLVRAGGVPQ